MSIMSIKEEVNQYLSGCGLRKVQAIYMRGIHNVTNDFNKNERLHNLYHEEFKNQAQVHLLTEFSEWLN